MFKWIATILIGVVVTLIAYSFTSNASAQDRRLEVVERAVPLMGERIATVEALRGEDSKRLERIENKVDQLLRKLP